MKADSCELNEWLEKVEQFLQASKPVPAGELDQLERLLDTSNVSSSLIQNLVLWRICFSLW